MDGKLDFWSNNFPTTLLQFLVYECMSSIWRKSAIYHRGLQPSNTGSLLFLAFHQHDVVKVRSQQ